MRRLDDLMICSEDMQQGCAMANVTFKYSENAAVGHSALQSCEPASRQFEISSALRQMYYAALCNAMGFSSGIQ